MHIRMTERTPLTTTISPHNICRPHLCRRPALTSDGCAKPFPCPWPWPTTTRQSPRVTSACLRQRRWPCNLTFPMQPCVMWFAKTLRRLTNNQHRKLLSKFSFPQQVDSDPSTGTCELKKWITIIIELPQHTCTITFTTKNLKNGQLKNITVDRNSSKPYRYPLKCLSLSLPPKTAYQQLPELFNGVKPFLLRACHQLVILFPLQ